MKLKTYIYSVALAGAFVSLTTSCDDMLDKGNDYVIYADDHTLDTPSDTVTSVAGIINKLQAIAVRNNLFGEVRGDLVKVNSNATSDLKDLAEFNVSDDNMYNVPRDYYAVINNCNYYLSKADSTAGNESRNEKYFEREIAQVHSIRAWTYLQLVKAYGSVPYVTEPILTKLESEASYPMKNIDEICELLIEDLQPYYATEYPNYVTIGGDIDPKMCFFPTQVVMGDLYLWRAVIAGKDNGEFLARQAAQCYYDYITWDLSAKNDLYTTSTRWYWEEASVSRGMLQKPSSNTLSSSTWGGTNCTDITMIPMDSAAADGYYNELRNLYNTTYVTDVSQASLSPSQYLIDLSENQSHVTYDNNKDAVEITKDRLSEEAIENHYLGDLRFQKDYNSMTTRYGTSTDEVDVQIINKHNSQHISVYRAAQLYLKLAEALNYAGYPRFAKQILVMGLNNNVIQYMVSPYYVNSGDSAFISYFDFNNNTYLPYATSYTQTVNEYGVVTSTTPVLRSDVSECNMWGVHSRGSGYAFLNDKYAPDLAPDSTSYPYTEEAAIPEKPATVPEPSVTNIADSLHYDEWAAAQSRPTEDKYNTYRENLADSIVEWNAYQAELAVYNTNLATFQTAYQEWYNDAYGSSTFIDKEVKQMDELILTEQALEMSYEGNRYYDLMRRAYWWNDNSYLTGMQDKTGAEKLSSRSNWFIHWDGQIGLYDDEEGSEE
ncbi:MAG: RagB/SusD family nutrient uptake outer membrane protein [Prevotellaceae bacterium]|nr:RagB/SusD family nutrient uptake outer membrane protein [Prevotellaceae bacterium]